MIVSSYHQYSTYFRFLLADQILWNEAFVSARPLYHAS
jgi:hypothetical protein